MLNTLLKKYPRAIPVSFLVLAILVSFWKLTTMRGLLITDDIFTGDLANGHLPYFHFLGESLKHGELPLWIPTIYSGFPFMGGGAGQWYPLNTLLFWLLPTFTALNLTLLLTLVIAAVGMFFYAREIGADLPGSLIAALSFAFSGFMISHLKHVTMVQSVCWAPLGIAIIERSIARISASGTRDGARMLLWLAPVFALQSLSGFTQTVYYSGLLYGLYFLFRLFNRQRALAVAGPKRAAPARFSALIMASLKNPLILWFIGVMALGSAMSAVQLLPTFDLVRQSGRTGGVTYEYATHFGYDPRDASMFVYPLANGDIGNGTYTAKGIFWEDYGYVGVFTLLLAILGIVRAWKTWHVRFLLGTAVLAFLLVLGKHSFVYGLAFDLIPGMSYFRFSTRFLFIVDACLAALAAIGTTSLGGILSGKGGKGGGMQKVSAVGLVLVGVVLADLLYFQLRQNAIVDAETWRTPPHTVQKILSDPGMFRVYSPAASETHKVAWRLANGWQGDLQPYVDQREFLQVNSNVLYGIASPEGYIQLAPSDVVDIWGDMNRGGLIMSTAGVQQGKFNARASFGNIMNLFNVKYIIAPWPIEGTTIRLLEQSNGVYVHENPGVLPRAFMVGRVREAHTLPAASGILLSSTFDPAREVILPERPALELDTNQSASHVEVVQYRNNDVQLKVFAGGSGVLVLSDTYFPGWKADLDGTEVPIMKANLCQRAVVVPAGVHMLQFSFRPRSFMIGSLVTGLSIVVFLATVVLMKKRGE
jgi:hypothetical protein